MSANYTAEPVVDDT